MHGFATASFFPRTFLLLLYLFRQSEKHRGRSLPAPVLFLPALNAQGKALAQALVRNVTQATSRPDRGAQWGYYYVTRSTVCPAVLLEAGFMVTPSEYENVTSEPQLWAAGDAIARSVLECVPPG